MKKIGKKTTNKLYYLLVVVVFALLGFYQNASSNNTTTQSSPSTSIEQAFKAKQSDVQIQGSGTVMKLLKDDLKGHKHQRFILKLTSNHTILIAHNIDLAPKIKTLKKNDTVEFYGEYEYNTKGGVIHWTHHDPKKRHIDGWLKHNNIIYQ